MPVASLPHANIWNDKLALLLESTGDGIFGIDLDGCCTFINRAGAAMLGLTPQAMLGRNMHEAMHHTHRHGGHYHETDCPIFRAFRQGLPCRVDTEVFWRADGQPFDVEYSSYPIVENGEVKGAVITFLDITERRRAEELLKRAKDELETRVAERTSELSAALSQLRELSAHSHSVREEERTRIAREIHDELGSLLVALKFDVNWMQRRPHQSTRSMASKCPLDGASDRRCGRKRRPHHHRPAAEYSRPSGPCSLRSNGRFRSFVTPPSSNANLASTLRPASRPPAATWPLRYSASFRKCSPTWHALCAGRKRPHRHHTSTMTP